MSSKISRRKKKRDYGDWRRNLSEAHSTLERHFREFNRAEYLLTDPVQFIHQYPAPADQELVGWIASAYAYGSTKVFIPRLRTLFSQMSSSPSDFLRNAPTKTLRTIAETSTYRFYQIKSLYEILSGLQSFYRQHESLRSWMEAHWNGDLLQSLAIFRSTLLQELRISHDYGAQYFFPDPERGVAKRLHLFMRWMVRRDEIDRGLWNFISPSQLFIPLDTHVFQLSRELGLTSRKQADRTAMLEITERLRQFDPTDPVRYDFSICRVGMLKRQTKTVEL